LTQGGAPNAPQRTKARKWRVIGGAGLDDNSRSLAMAACSDRPRFFTRIAADRRVRLRFVVFRAGNIPFLASCENCRLVRDKGESPRSAFGQIVGEAWPPDWRPFFYTPVSCAWHIGAIPRERIAKALGVASAVNTGGRGFMGPVSLAPGPPPSSNLARLRIGSCAVRRKSFLVQILK